MIIYYPDQPPAVDEANALLADKGRLRTLKVQDPGSGRRMSKRLEVVRRLKEQVGGQKIVEGWVEGPLAESADLRGINTVMLDLLDDPAFVRDLMAFIYENAMNFAREQVKAGADVIGVGDAASSLIGPELYRGVVLEWEKKYVETIHAMGALVRLHICGDTNALFPLPAEVKADIVDLDSMALIADARAAMGPRAVAVRQHRPGAGAPGRHPDGGDRSPGSMFRRCRRPVLCGLRRLRNPARHPAGEPRVAMRDFARGHRE